MKRIHACHSDSHVVPEKGLELAQLVACWSKPADRQLDWCEDDYVGSEMALRDKVAAEIAKFGMSAPS